MMCVFVNCFFFFQAEDGIRDLTVTGVQTCALPILVGLAPFALGQTPDVIRIQLPAMTAVAAGDWLTVGISGVTTHTDRKSTRLNSSHSQISYAVFCLKKKKRHHRILYTILDRRAPA